jgi:hypothetical protein
MIGLRRFTESVSSETELKAESSKEKMFTVVHSPFTDKKLKAERKRCRGRVDPAPARLFCHFEQREKYCSCTM